MQQLLITAAIPPIPGAGFQPLVGEHTGLVWHVICTPHRVLSPTTRQFVEDGNPHYSARLGRSQTGRLNDYELHEYALYDSRFNRYPDLEYDPTTHGRYHEYLDIRARYLLSNGLRTGYDHLVHTDWSEFYTHLQAQDGLIATYLRDGWPPTIGAAVSPLPPPIVDGTKPVIQETFTIAGPSPAEKAFLQAHNLHETDLGYDDPAAQDWLG